MLKGHGNVIDPKKSAEFCAFLKTAGKTKEFWEENNRVASTQIDKEELERLLKKD